MYVYFYKKEECSVTSLALSGPCILRPAIQPKNVPVILN